jgi:hypothetical protein
VFAVLVIGVGIFYAFRHGRNPLALFAAAFSACKRALTKLDQRYWTIIILVVACIVGTVVVYALGLGRDPVTLFGAIFSAWTGGLALFVITGIVIAFFSLAKPEHESFDARARILFRRQPGRHIDYIVSKIKEVLEHYAKKTTVKVTIMRYDEETRRFLLGVQDSITVRSYLDDVDTTWNSDIDYSEITSPPEGGVPNKLVYVRIDGVPTVPSEVFTDSIKRPISTRIQRDAML